MEEGGSWRRRLLIGLGLVLLIVVATGWLASSARTVEVQAQAESILVINDAGPVRIRSGPSVDEAAAADLSDDVPSEGGAAGSIDLSGVVVRSTSSWLLRQPDIESLSRGGELVVRATCPSVLPCRVSLEVFVPLGIELTVVAANDLVQIDSFDGSLLAFTGDEGVSLGSVTGSVSVVSEGPVRGTTLGPAELTIEAIDDPVQLTYLDVPTVLAITAVNAPVTVELPADASYAIDAEGDDVSVGVDADDLADQRVSIRTGGRVIVEPTLTEPNE